MATATLPPVKARTPTGPLAAPPSPLAERELSFGEQVFDFIVYKGIGFGVNEVVSIVLADEFEHGVGKPHFDKWGEGLVKKFPKFFKETIENGVVKATAKQNAANTLMTIALLNGGTLLLGPMMSLDNNKTAIVEWLNHTFASQGMTPEQIKARDEEVRNAIACEPRQTLGTMLPARGAALATTITFGSKVMGPVRNEAVKKKSREVITQGIKALGGHNFAENERVKRYAGLAGVEAIYCAISCVVLETVAKFLAGNKKIPKNPEVCETAVAGGNADAAPPPKDEKSSLMTELTAHAGHDGASASDFRGRYAGAPSARPTKSRLDAGYAASLSQPAGNESPMLGG